MTTALDLLSPNVQSIEPEASVQRASQLMRQYGLAFLPVCVGRQVVGMITHRDIVVRSVADGAAPDQACVSDTMTPMTVWGTADHDLIDLSILMREHRLDQLPVVTGNLELIGVVTTEALAQALNDPRTRALPRKTLQRRPSEYR